MNKKTLEWQRKYRRDNPEINRESARKRRFDLSNNGGLGYLPEEWEDLKRKTNYSCVCCGRREPEIKLCVDHIEPLSKGGINEIQNIQPLCRACNTKKSNKTINFIKSFLGE